MIEDTIEEEIEDEIEDEIDLIVVSNCLPGVVIWTRVCPKNNFSL